MYEYATEQYHKKMNELKKENEQKIEEHKILKEKLSHIYLYSWNKKQLQKEKIGSVVSFGGTFFLSFLASLSASFSVCIAMVGFCLLTTGLGIYHIAQSSYYKKELKKYADLDSYTPQQLWQLEQDYVSRENLVNTQIAINSNRLDYYNEEQFEKICEENDKDPYYLAKDEEDYQKLTKTKQMCSSILEEYLKEAKYKNISFSSLNFEEEVSKTLIKKK